MNTAQKDLAMSTFPTFATLSSTDTISPQETLDTLRAWSEAGWLRRLDSALAAFMAELDPHPAPAVLVATALLAQMEGRGHSCLPLAPLLAQPGAVLGWPATALAELDALLLRLPHGLADWRAGHPWGCSTPSNGHKHSQASCPGRCALPPA